MFCPKCATQNIDGAKFCRSCGADISLVPHAMTGQIATVASNEIDDDRDSRRRRKRERPPSFEKGIKNIFMGLGFLFLSMALAFVQGRKGWWVWLLIPAFSMMGGGVAEYLRSRNAQKELRPEPGPAQTAIPRAQQMAELPPRSTSELVAPPPSVTEGTTRHLGVEAPTKVFAPAERPNSDR